MSYIYSVLFDTYAAKPISVVAESVPEAMDKAVAHEVERGDWVDSSNVVSVERGQKIDVI